jgi:hypothetical protein
LVRSVRRGQSVLRARWAFKVSRAQLGNRASQVLLEFKALQESKDHRENRAPRALKAKREAWLSITVARRW